MSKLRLVLSLVAIVLTQQAFADSTSAMPTSSSKDPSCEAVANACLAGGYVRTETAGKMIWQDCMKPLLMGKSVSGVTMDAATAKACRMHRISEMTQELQDLQSVK